MTTTVLVEQCISSLWYLVHNHKGLYFSLAIVLTSTSWNWSTPHHFSIHENACNCFCSLGFNKPFFTNDWNRTSQLKVVPKPPCIDWYSRIRTLIMSKCLRTANKQTNKQTKSIGESFEHLEWEKVIFKKLCFYLEKPLFKK